MWSFKTIIKKFDILLICMLMREKLENFILVGKRVTQSWRHLSQKSKANKWKMLLRQDLDLKFGCATIVVIYLCSVYYVDVNKVAMSIISTLLCEDITSWNNLAHLYIWWIFQKLVSQTFANLVHAVLLWRQKLTALESNTNLVSKPNLLQVKSSKCRCNVKQHVG